MITDLIHLCDTLDNLYLKQQLEKLKTLIETTPNNLELGREIRKLL